MPAITDASVFERFATIKRHRRNGGNAPNKPVTLLWALDRVAQGAPRLTPFANAETELRPLLDVCGTPRTAPSYAFWRLQNDGLWEVRSSGPLTRRSGDKEPLVTAMRAHARGGLERSVHKRLEASEDLRHRVELLLQDHLGDPLAKVASRPQPSSWETVRRRAREVAFRDLVLRAYQRRCVVCGWSFRLGHVQLALQAAHVHPLGEGGPDSPDNGLALCAFHHPLFDAGLFTWNGRRRLLVSSRWRDDQRGQMPSLLDHAGRVLPQPLPDFPMVSDNTLAWHRQHVFLA